MTPPPRRLPLRPGRPPLTVNLALLAGLLATAGLPPFPWTGALVPVALALLAVQLVRAERPAAVGWAFGLAHQATLLSWLFLLVPAKTIPFAALKHVQAVVTIFYVSLFYLAVGWAFGRLRRRLGVDRAVLLLPVLWVAMELLRSRGELAFSWCLSGAAVAGTPLQGLLRAAGEPGVGAATALLGTAGAAWWLVRQGQTGARTAHLATAAAGTWCLLLVAGAAVRTPPPAAATAGDSLRTVPLVVAAVQADVALADKWDKARIDSTKIPYETLTVAAAGRGAELAVWAETAVPAYVRHDPPLLAWTRGVVRKAGIPLFAGFPDATRDPSGEVLTFNSSGLFTADGLLQDRYAKHHLLPVGEAMPFSRWLPFLAKVDVGQAEWTPGPPAQPIVLGTDRGAFPFAAMICFESILGHLARDAVGRGGRCLMVITNDGWFGQSAGPRQHAVLARLRAVECAVPVVRAANNGISLICDDRGRLLGELDLGRRGVVQAAIVPGRADSLFLRLGAGPVAAAALLWTGLVLARGPRRDRGPGRGRP
ncbi:MAG: apolipoprotein N-acyltransferase [Candidatus Krumholzibacteriia bacterium]